MYPFPHCAATPHLVGFHVQEDSLPLYVTPRSLTVANDVALLDLMEHEKVIEQGLNTFIDVGNALVAIRDGKKYRAAGYGTFEDYCQRRWEISKQYAGNLMRAAEIVRELETETETIVSVLPKTEGQVRPLAPLRNEPEKVREAWAEAVDRAGGDQPTAAQVAEVVAERTAPPERAPIQPEIIRPPAPRPPAPAYSQPVERPPVIKPDLGCGVSHPARFSDELIPVFVDLLDGHDIVLDPFAGTGKIHQLQDHGHATIGIEIEPEWATLHPDTIPGSALELPFPDASFDAICTSPTYGNRLADSHNASDPHLRRSYTHDLGRQLHEDNSGSMQWGGEYRDFHKRAWAEAIRVLKVDGVFVLNIKDHIRGGEWMDVAGWHIAELVGQGLEVEAVRPVVTGHLRQGTNAELRVPAELVISLRKVTP